MIQCFTFLKRVPPLRNGDSLDEASTAALDAFEMLRDDWKFKAAEASSLSAAIQITGGFGAGKKGGSRLGCSFSHKVCRAAREMLFGKQAVFILQTQTESSGKIRAEAL